MADHVTLAAKVARHTLLPDPAMAMAMAIGQVDVGQGVQALVVDLDGTTDRPAGGTYHVTWSLGPGRTAKESNDAPAACDWQRFDDASPLRLEPARF